MVDVSLLFIYVIANFTVAYASFRSLPAYMSGGQYTDLDEDDGQEMKLSMALTFIVSASLGLVFLFYFVATLSKVMLVGISIVSCLAFIFLIEPYLEKMLPETLLRQEMSLPVVGAVNWLTLIEMPLGVGVVIVWLLARDTQQEVTFPWTMLPPAWFMNDVLAFAICVLMISSVRIKDMKVASVLLCGILCYDVFWVYLSPYVFGKNVMVTVAGKIDLPIKIVVPYFKGEGQSMIGLGDMVLPGLLTGFLLRFDRGRNDVSDMYFTTCMVGYAMGLALCLLVLITFHAAQPAMLYLSPCTLLCVYGQASRRKEIGMLWRGDYSYEAISTDDLSL
jgi:hypothetical protein